MSNYKTEVKHFEQESRVLFLKEVRHSLYACFSFRFRKLPLIPRKMTFTQPKIAFWFTLRKKLTLSRVPLAVAVLLKES